VLYNMIPAAEQHVDFIAEAIAFLDRQGLDFKWLATEAIGAVG
jgi:hypothetical protein